jgi:hypothetical protein
MILLSFVFYFFAIKQIRWSPPLGSITQYFPGTAFLSRREIFKDQYPPKRNYTDIVFTGIAKDDKIKLQFARIRIREILLLADTVNGLNFLFTENCRYETFISTLDMLRVEEAKYYLPVVNHIWFFHEPPIIETDSLKITPIGCGFVPVEHRISWGTKVWRNVVHVWRSS